jgi:hypothetical protein
MEAPDDPIQIEIRKGAYVPQFRRLLHAAQSNGKLDSSEALVEQPPPAPSPAVVLERKPKVLSARKTISAVAVVGSALLLYWYADSLRKKPGTTAAERQTWTPEMTAFWAPFLAKETPLIISYEKRLFFFAPSAGLVVRDAQTNYVVELPGSKPLAGFRARMGAKALHETFDYADFGAVHAAFLSVGC